MSDNKYRAIPSWIDDFVNSLKKVTKKGETIGLVKERNNKQFIEADGKEYALTSAWNKLSTRFNFNDIASDIYLISSRLHFVVNLLKKGPIKGELLKTIDHSKEEIVASDIEVFIATAVCSS